MIQKIPESDGKAGRAPKTSEAVRPEDRTQVDEAAEVDGDAEVEDEDEDEDELSAEADADTDADAETDTAAGTELEAAGPADDGDDPSQASGDEPGEDASEPSELEASDRGLPAADDEGGEDGEAPEPGGSDRPLDLRIEAVLFAAGQALSPLRLSKVLEEPVETLKPALEGLATRWAERDSALELVEIAGGWRFMTRPGFQPDVAGLARKARAERLSPAALETLAVVAYRQPIGRADIEAVRGVAAGPLLRVLLDRDLIRITGRSPEPGHPLLYGTTRRFLDHFGLRSLKSLPDIKDLLDVS
jgi:segregation and condensation protein B